MKIVDYLMVIELHPTNLQAAVRILLPGGWQPYGNPFEYRLANCDTPGYAQTMVKYAD